MGLTIVNKLYLELSQFATAKTKMISDWVVSRRPMKSIMDQGSLHGFDNPPIAGMAYRMADAMMEEREKYTLVPQSESMACDVMDCRL